jgi:hypothetical protein
LGVSAWPKIGVGSFEIGMIEAVNAVDELATPAANSAEPPRINVRNPFFDISTTS